MAYKPLIIVLDTDSAFVEMISEFLDDEGYEALPLSENQQAFDVILKRQPQLVFIELLVINPEAGLMVLNKMRLHPETSHIPVIIGSTITQLLRDNEEHLRSKGCDLLQKPFNLEELLTIVSKHVAPPTK